LLVNFDNGYDEIILRADVEAGRVSVIKKRRKLSQAQKEKRGYSIWSGKAIWNAFNLILMSNDYGLRPDLLISSGRMPHMILTWILSEMLMLLVHELWSSKVNVEEELMTAWTTPAMRNQYSDDEKSD